MAYKELMTSSLRIWLSESASRVTTLARTSSTTSTELQTRNTLPTIANICTIFAKTDRTLVPRPLHTKKRGRGPRGSRSMSCSPKTGAVSNRAARPLERFTRYFELLVIANRGGRRCSRDLGVHSRGQHGWGSGVRRARVYASMGPSVSYRREVAGVWKLGTMLSTAAHD